MLRFREWLLVVEGRVAVPAAVLSGYEHAFKDELRQLIQRTQDPALRAKGEPSDLVQETFLEAHRGGYGG